MRLKLLFPDVDIKNLSRDNYITIYKNKLVEYDGIYPIVFFIEPTHQVREKGKLYLNDTYALEKIDKYDRLSYGVRATYLISCNLLSDYVHEPCFVKLSLFQRIYAKWYLKRYFIQDINFKKDLWKILLGAILGSVLTLLIRGLLK
jgi:hypothetical protein